MAFDAAGDLWVGETASFRVLESIPVPAKRYAVGFAEVGLTSGASCSVTFAGSTARSTTSWVTHPAASGTYSNSVPGVSGCTANPSSGAVPVSATNVSVTIAFTWTTLGLPPITWWVVLALVFHFLATLEAVLLARRRRRRGGPVAPPPTVPGSPPSAPGTPPS